MGETEWNGMDDCIIDTPLSILRKMVFQWPYAWQIRLDPRFEWSRIDRVSSDGAWMDRIERG
jgi:hypothetical protein